MVLMVFSQNKYRFPLLTFLVTTLLTLLLLYVVQNKQQQYSYALFDNLAQRQSLTLEEFLKRDIEFIGAGANYFQSTTAEEWDGFQVFASKIIESSDTLIALEWMPKVEYAQITQHMKQLNARFPDARLYTVPEDQPKTFDYVLTPPQPIFVISDIYPLSKENRSLLGFYPSHRRFQLVLSDMAMSGKPSVSDKVRLLQDGVDKNLKKDGILVYHPVFSRTDEQVLSGVVIGVIRSTAYFENLMAKTATEQQLEVRVLDLGYDAEDDPILFESADWAQTNGIEIGKTIVLPNRSWRIEFRLPANVTAKDQLLLVGFMIGGILIAMLLSYIVYLQTRDREYLTAMLEKRTEELEYLVDHDTLTGLYNRRAFNKFMKQKVMCSERFALVGFDIDHFKKVNDLYGHVVGDEVLKKVAERVSNIIKPTDTLIRMGGDEFCILSAETDKIELHHYLDEIRKSVEKNTLEFEGSWVTVTLSMGAAVRIDEDEEALLQAADAQLYHSKESGRNQVSVV